MVRRSSRLSSSSQYLPLESCGDDVNDEDNGDGGSDGGGGDHIHDELHTHKEHHRKHKHKHKHQTPKRTKRIIFILSTILCTILAINYFDPFHLNERWYSSVLKKDFISIATLHARFITDAIDTMVIRNGADTSTDTSTSPSNNLSKWLKYYILGGSGSGGEFESTDEKSPGQIMAEEGYRANHPVILIPGITGTNLELWQGLQCSMKGSKASGGGYFRHRLWGTLSMIRMLLTDTPCWLKHLRLCSGDESPDSVCPYPTSDPKGVRLRPSIGMEASDFLVPGFWVLAKIIENLSHIGYDHNNLQVLGYDWRLDPLALEERDNFFSKLAQNIEQTYVNNNNTTVVIACHSLGGVLSFYFQSWVENRERLRSPHTYQKGKWIGKYINSIITIGTPYLGAPKTASMYISGEGKITAQLGRWESMILEKIMGRRERLSLFRTWTSGLSLLPKGGNVIWGCGGTSSSSKNIDSGRSYGIINFVGKDHLSEDGGSSIDDVGVFDRCVIGIEDGCGYGSGVSGYDGSVSGVVSGSNNNKNQNNQNSQSSYDRSHSGHLCLGRRSFMADDLLVLLTKYFLPNSISKRAIRVYSKGLGISRTVKEGVEAFLSGGVENHSSSWLNPLVTPLVPAENLTIYSFYGVGVETERAFVYEEVSPDKWNDNGGQHDHHIRESTMDKDVWRWGKSAISKIRNCIKTDNLSHMIIWWKLYKEKRVGDDASLSNGIHHVDGDGTVTLISNGLMASYFWKEGSPLYEVLNPGKVKVVCREYEHKPSGGIGDLRNGPGAGDHIDILGNHELISDILRIVSHNVTASASYTTTSPLPSDRIFSDVEEMAKKIVL